MAEDCEARKHLSLRYSVYSAVQLYASAAGNSNPAVPPSGDVSDIRREYTRTAHCIAEGDANTRAAPICAAILAQPHFTGLFNIRGRLIVCSAGDDQLLRILCGRCDSQLVAMGQFLEQVEKLRSANMKLGVVLFFSLPKSYAPSSACWEVHMWMQSNDGASAAAMRTGHLMLSSKELVIRNGGIQYGLDMRPPPTEERDSAQAARWKTADILTLGPGVHWDVAESAKGEPNYDCEGCNLFNALLTAERVHRAKIVMEASTKASEHAEMLERGIAEADKEKVRIQEMDAVTKERDSLIATVKMMTLEMQAKGKTLTQVEMSLARKERSERLMRKQVGEREVATRKEHKSTLEATRAQGEAMRKGAVAEAIAASKRAMDAEQKWEAAETADRALRAEVQDLKGRLDAAIAAGQAADAEVDRRRKHWLVLFRMAGRFVLSQLRARKRNKVMMEAFPAMLLDAEKAQTCTKATGTNACEGPSLASLVKSSCEEVLQPLISDNRELIQLLRERSKETDASRKEGEDDTSHPTEEGAPVQPYMEAQQPPLPQGYPPIQHVPPHYRYPQAAFMYAASANHHGYWTPQCGGWYSPAHGSS